MTLLDLDASVAAVISWLLTYAIHSTILLGAAALVARRFSDEHAWLERVWKVAMVGAIVTTSVQVGSHMSPLGGRWQIAFGSEMGRDGTAVSPAPLPYEMTSESIEADPVPTGDVRPSSTERLPASSRHREPSQAWRAPAPQAAPTMWHALASRWPLGMILGWLAIASFHLIRLAVRRARLQRVLRAGARPPDSNLTALIADLRDASGLPTPVHLTVSEGCAMPMALPGRRIVLPRRFGEDLDMEQQRAALAHEMAHVARRDPAWLVVCVVLERLFFFQPLNRLARIGLCESAEFLCDEWAVRATRSPLALARCLATVAAWACPGDEQIPSAASPMARSDSPLLRRVQRIVDEPYPAARRPSAVWMTLAVMVVVVGAPVVSATALSVRSSVRLFPAAPSADHAVTNDEDESQTTAGEAPRQTNAARVGQALSVHRTPQPGDPLGRRWQWALDEAGRRNIQEFWIVYTFQTPIHAQDLMMSDSRGDSIVSRQGRMQSPGPSMTELLEASPAIGGPGNVAVMFHHTAARRGAIDRGGYRSVSLGFDFGSTAVFWLGYASEPDSFKQMTELADQVRQEKVQVLIIEAASLHPTTDMVLPFLTRMLEPGHAVAIRREAAEGFDHHHDPRSVEILLRTARTDTSSDVRSEAAETIGEVQTPQSIPALTELATNSPDAAVRREAAEAFADQPPDQALPALDRLIASSTHEEVVVEAIEALGDIDDDRAAAMLQKIAWQHQSRRAQQEAVETLGDIDTDAAVVELERLVWDHKDTVVQREAVETLGDHSNAAAIRAIERVVLEHRSEDVQAEAIETLADQADGQVSALILQTSRTGRSPRLRREAIAALGGQASSTSDPRALDQIEQTIEHAIFNDADHGVRRDALEALEELPRDRALRVLRKVIDRHPDAEIREEALDLQRERSD